MHFDPPIVPLSAVVPFPVAVVFDHRDPCFQNFNSTLFVDDVRVNLSVDSFLDTTSVPVRISINKLDLFQIGY